MTATATPLRQRVPAPPPVERRSVSPGRGPGAGLEPVVAMVLATVTLVAVPGVRGLLGAAHSLAAVVAAAVLMHAVPAVCRAWKRGAEPVLSLGAFLVLLTWLSLGDTTVAGIPTAETWDAAVTGLGEALAALDDRTVPGLAEPEVVSRGRLVLGVFAVLSCALMADQASFRVRSAFLALVPSLSLVLIGATRAPAANRGLSVGLYLAAALAFLLVHHSMVARESSVVVTGRRPFRLTAVVPAAALVGAAVVAGGLFAGPRLPGYGKEGVVKVSGSQTGNPRSPDPATAAVNPFIDIDTTLVERSNVEMFTVTSPVPTYWRLTSLDSFNGKVWSAPLDSDGGWRQPVETSVTSFQTVTQVFDIQGLRGDWLPAAYRPQWVVYGEARLDRAASESLRPQGTIRTGIRYEVGSMVPRPTSGLLLQVSRSAGERAARRYLEVPPQVSARVRDEAFRVVREAGFQGPYAQARALQDYFRENFAYDLDVPRSHDEDALERFLFRNRRGYCEQFAAAYAVMARIVGLPSRVAVGFTPGELQADGRYHVRGLNAHAWPEVFFEGAGWVAFEPTPGRGMPGAEDYTGVAADQESPRRGGELPPDVSVPTTTPTTVTPTTTPGEPAPSTDATPSTASPATTAVTDGGGTSGTGGGMTLPAAGGAVAGAAAAAMLVPAAKRLRRRRRWARAAGPNELALLAWAEADQALGAAGLGRRPAETLMGHAARITTDARLPETLREPVLQLAGTAGTASYSGRAIDGEAATLCRQAAASIDSGVRAVTPLPRRLLRALDPRSLLKP